MVQWSTNTDANGPDAFNTEWTAGWNADAKASFAWGLGEDINTLTGETEHLLWNPYADVYGYGYAYFEASAENAMFGFSVYVSPLNLHLIDIKFQLTNGLCVDISTI